MLLNAAYVAALPVADHVLRRQRSAAPGARRSLAVVWLWRASRKARADSLPLAGRRCLGLYLALGRRHHQSLADPLGAHRARRRRARDPGAAQELAAVWRCWPSLAAALRFGTPQARIRNPQVVAALHDRRRRRTEVALLALVGATPTPAASSLPTSSWTRSSAASATRTSTSSGTARCTTSRRSTISSTAGIHRAHAGAERHAGQQVVRRLSRPRRLLQRPLRPAHQGAGAIPRKRRTAWAAYRATPSCTWAAAWATAISPFSTRRCTGSRPATIRGSASSTTFITYLNPEPHRTTFMKAFMRQDSAEYCATCHKVHLDRAGEPLPLAARLQRVRQLAGQRRLGTGSAIVLLSAQIVHLLGLPHAAGCLAAIPAIANGMIHSHRFAGGEHRRRVRQ